MYILGTTYYKNCVSKQVKHIILHYMLSYIQSYFSAIWNYTLHKNKIGLHS